MSDYGDSSYSCSDTSYSYASDSAPSCDYGTSIDSSATGVGSSYASTSEPPSLGSFNDYSGAAFGHYLPASTLPRRNQRPTQATRHDTPLSRRHDRWTGDPAVDRAALVARATAAMHEDNERHRAERAAHDAAAKARAHRIYDWLIAAGAVLVGIAIAAAIIDALT